MDDVDKVEVFARDMLDRNIVATEVKDKVVEGISMKGQGE